MLRPAKFLAPISLAIALMGTACKTDPSESPAVSDTNDVSSGSQATSAPTQSAVPRAGSNPPSAEPTPNSHAASSAPRADNALFIARFLKPLTVTSMAASARLVTRNGCLVADFGEQGVATLVLPPHAKVEGPANAPTAVVLNTHRLVVGARNPLPAAALPSELATSFDRSPLVARLISSFLEAETIGRSWPRLQ